MIFNSCGFLSTQVPAMMSSGRLKYVFLDTCVAEVLTGEKGG